ncbi:MAG: flagellar assembly protein FliH [Pseudomonadota bacterium]
MSELPKEQQSAYQRWEMASFGDERPSVVAKRPPPVELPTEAMVTAIREQARLEGYGAGYEAGQAAGYADAMAIRREQNARELEHLRALTASFGQAVASADETICADLLDLALHLAKGMFKNALEVRPELIIPVVREAIEYLPVLQQPALLLLNPADAELVREGIGEELDKGGWRLVEDPQIGRGGCKIDTPSNQIDATAASRWARLTSTLGHNVDWLGP